jgi:hypothetical protein
MGEENSQETYQVRSPNWARNPSAIVFGCNMGTIYPAIFDWAASSAPEGSAAMIWILGLIDFAAIATPEVSPPPAKAFSNIKGGKKNSSESSHCSTN